METALTTINEFPSTRDELKRFIGIVKSEILVNKEPLKVLVQLKYIEKTIADLLKDEDIDSLFLHEAQQYSEKEQIVISGAKLNIQEAGTKYDYASSGDPVWIDLDKQINDLSEKKKEREMMLKALPEEGLVEPSTGLYINRPPKSSKTKVAVRI